MIVEGFLSYQPFIDNSFYFEKAGNFLSFKNGFIHHDGFESNDPFFSILAGGTHQHLQKKSWFSNVKIESDLSSNHFTEFILNSLSVKPTIGVWYDESVSNLYLSREIFGCIPFFYIHIPNLFVAFSTSLTSLLKKKEVKPYLDLNLNKITLYASYSFKELYQNPSDTFFSNIKTVLPGHLLTITPDSVLDSIPFETFRPERWSHLNTSSEFASAVKETLLTSIINATNSGDQIIGSHLSGGLDSSSVSSLFKFQNPDRPLHTYHVKANNKDSDESHYAATVAKHINSTHHIVSHTQDELSFLKMSTSLYGHPESSYLSNASGINTIYLAKESGCDVLLNGHGGDSVIGSGMEVLDDAFEKKNWEQLQLLLRKRIPYFISPDPHPDWENYSEDKKYYFVLHYFLYTRIPQLRKLPIKKLVELYRDILPNFDISYLYFIKRAFKNLFLRLLKTNVLTKPSIVKSDLCDGLKNPVDMINHPQSLLNGLGNKYAELFEDVFHEYAIQAQEEFFVLSNYYGISVRAPFLNKDLLELCMAIPDLVKYGNGIGRQHLRDGMKGILSEAIRYRSTKTSLSSSEGEDITFRLYNQSGYYLELTREVWKFIDRKKFDKQVVILKNKKIPYDQKSRTYFHITRTISLSVWLEWLKENDILNVNNP